MLIPVKEVNVNKSLSKILQQIADKNNVLINNLKVKDMFNKISDEVKIDVRDSVDE